jgi:hypothetical protein
MGPIKAKGSIKMAAPTPTTSLNQMGKAFVASWSGVWAATGEFTDTIVVDLSALNYTNRIRILKIHIAATAGISATLEWDDASANELIYRHPLGVVGNIVLDYEPIGASSGRLKPVLIQAISSLLPLQRRRQMKSPS